jgi:hypothetical protein
MKKRGNAETAEENLQRARTSLTFSLHFLGDL